MIIGMKVGDSLDITKSDRCYFEILKHLCITHHVPLNSRPQDLSFFLAPKFRNAKKGIISPKQRKLMKYLVLQLLNASKEI